MTSNRIFVIEYGLFGQASREHCDDSAAGNGSPYGGQHLCRRRLQVPHSRLSGELQRIQRSGGKIFKVCPASTYTPCPPVEACPGEEQHNPGGRPTAVNLSHLPMDKAPSLDPGDDHIPNPGQGAAPHNGNMGGMEEGADPVVTQGGVHHTGGEGVSIETPQEPVELPVPVGGSEVKPVEGVAEPVPTNQVPGALTEEAPPPPSEPEPSSPPTPRTPPALLGAQGFIALVFASQLLPILHYLPLVPEMLQLIGAGITLWSIYRWLLFAEDRRNLWKLVRQVGGLESETGARPAQDKGAGTATTPGSAQPDLGEASTVILEVDGLWGHPRTYPRTAEGYARLQIPYHRLSAEVQQILRKGAKIVNVYSKSSVDLPQASEQPEVESVQVASRGWRWEHRPGQAIDFLDQPNLDTGLSRDSESEEQVIHQAPSSTISGDASNARSASTLVNWAALAVTSVQGILVVLIAVQVLQQFLVW